MANMPARGQRVNPCRRTTCLPGAVAFREAGKLGCPGRREADQGGPGGLGKSVIFGFRPGAVSDPMPGEMKVYTFGDALAKQRTDGLGALGSPGAAGGNSRRRREMPSGFHPNRAFRC